MALTNFQFSIYSSFTRMNEVTIGVVKFYIISEINNRWG